MNPRRIFVDMDGTLAKWNNVESENVLYEKGYYENLQPNENLLNAIKNLIAKGENVFILSSFLHDSKYALAEKNYWLDKYLPELPQDKRIFTNYGDDKSIYVIGGITNNDYLIDDYTKNLLEWKELGGIGIKYLNGINHSKGTWKGLLLKDSDFISNDLETILNHPEKELDNFNQEFKESEKEFENAIQQYSLSINSSIEDLINAELRLKEAKERFLGERSKLLELYDIEIIETWQESEDLAIHYKVNFKDGKPLYEGYNYIEKPKNYTNDSLINEVMNFDVKEKIDISKVPSEIKYFVDAVLGNDMCNTIRVYGEDLADYLDIEEEKLPEKMDVIQEQLEHLGLKDFIDIQIIDTYPRTIKYIDIDPTIICQFDFANKDYQRKTINYNINGKNVLCEIEYNDRMKGYSVMGYTVDNKFNTPNKIQQVLTPEELEQVKEYLINEVNQMFNEKCNNELNDLDIAEDYY